VTALRQGMEGVAGLGSFTEARTSLGVTRVMQNKGGGAGPRRAQSSGINGGRAAV
jgi:hypothetical protein